VLIDDEPALSCVTLAGVCDGKRVTTVEGLVGREADVVREAFAEAGASQCGYCTPGMTVMVNYVLSRGPGVDLLEELSGNLCRCTGYTKIIEACKRSIELANE
jgi:carbon-monoxide dehydrogenase small subunit